MSCAACSARVEKAVSKLDGVESCSVSLLTNSMSVTGNVNENDVISAVRAAGYGARLKGTEKKGKASEQNAELTGEQAEKEAYIHLKNRLAYSVVFLVMLMYVSMGHVMLGFPFPKRLAENAAAIGIIELLLTVSVMFINREFFVSGFKAIIKRAPNMDSLVAMGSMAAFVYSTAVLFMITDASVYGNLAHAGHLLHELYFESAAMILTLITVGKALETRSKGKTADALRSLIKLSPKTAVVLRDGNEVTVPADELSCGDIFIVKPGSSIPADGIVVEGVCSVDESAITGESVPADKKDGDTVSAATINMSGFVKCRATRVGEDTTLSQIIKLVSDAAATKAPSARIADKVSGIFVPAVMCIAVITALIWLTCGQSVGFALARGISVLVISCPCALGLATPVAIMVGNGLGAKNGILFKNSEALENIGKIKNVIFDKTGTVTEGKMMVTDVLCADGNEVNDLLSAALSAEKKSEHPIALAVVSYAENNGACAYDVGDFKNTPGKGISAVLDNAEIRVGNYDYISEVTVVPSKIVSAAKELANCGKTVLYLCKANEFLGIMAVSDTVKPDAPDAVRKLKGMGIGITMLTGDNEVNAMAVGKLAGIDKVIAGVLPDEKEKTVKAIKAQGMCAMVGDGINDAPALAAADVGIAIGAGTDVAIDSADVVLVNSKAEDIPAAVRLGRATVKNIHQNLFWAFFYNIIGIPLAAGIWYPAFGITLNPMFAAAAMSLSSVFVVTNALRLNRANIRSTKHDKIKKLNLNEKEKNMKITLKIQGMMCPHCEATVQKALSEINGVNSVEVSHEKGIAVIEANDSVSEMTLKDVVVSKGYKVL